MLAGFGIGNGVQANSIADALNNQISIPAWLTGIVTAVLVGFVLLGGIKRIAEVVGKLVPIMAISYIVAGLALLVIFADRISSGFCAFVFFAFNPISGAGGF